SPFLAREVAGAVAVIPLPRSHGSHTGLRVRAVARGGSLFCGSGGVVGGGVPRAALLLEWGYPIGRATVHVTVPSPPPSPPAAAPSLASSVAALGRAVDQDLLNQRLQDVTEPQLSTKLKAGKAGSHLRNGRTQVFRTRRSASTSRTSDWRKRNAEGEMAQHAKSYQRIDQDVPTSYANGLDAHQAEDAERKLRAEKKFKSRRRIRQDD
ncbi:MAG: hypothetical protein BJ554DRAFT_2906, partial [Olpidium bornovanus]